MKFCSVVFLTFVFILNVTNLHYCVNLNQAVIKKSNASNFIFSFIENYLGNEADAAILFEAYKEKSPSVLEVKINNTNGMTPLLYAIYKKKL